jgi:phosphatidylglycerophosphatase A
MNLQALKLARFIASAGGAGFAPKAPGTFGSLVGLVIGVLLLKLGHGPLLAGVFVASFIGVWAVWMVDGEYDPGWIVIDEVAGMMITMLGLPRVTITGLIIAFALFRLFDIWKPGPVGLADRQHNAIGVMADDWVAGLLAFVCVLLIVILTPLGWF